jgi:hypothetical protein
MIKETSRSLEQYIGIIGIGSILLGVIGFSMNRNSLLLEALSLVTATFGIIYLVVAVRFTHFFPQKAQFIKRVLLANLGFRVVQVILLSLLTGALVGHFSLAFAVVIYLYLIKNINRLVHESPEIA